MIVITIVVLVIGWFALLYWLIGYFPTTVWRWVATLGIGLLPAAVALGYKLGLIQVRSHISGIEKGITQVMSAANQAADVRLHMVHESQRPTQKAAQSRYPERFDDFLPKPSGAVIVQRNDGDSEVVDL